MAHRRRSLRWIHLIRIKAKDVDIEPRFSSFLPDRLKTRKMCEVVKDLRLSKYVLYWFVTQQQTDVWYDDNYWYHDDEIIEWYNGYQKGKAQKA